MVQIQLRQLWMIIISWMIIGFLIAVYDYLVLHTNNSAGPAPGYSLLLSIAVNMGMGLFGALLGGSFLIFYVNVRFRDKSYGYTIFAVTVSFIVIILLINLILRALGNPDTARLQKNGLVWAVVVGVTQLLVQVNNKFGQGNFWNIITGKYNTPREERRIFMFLDLNASTTLAEKLGDKKYHEMLKDFFTDITNPILNNHGEIYQYVGDEVVIAWKYDDGIAGSKCVKCFFDIKLHIEGLKDKYLKQYGTVPSFKAGLHCGQVVAGEVGIIKRDITYSGDVLNTTSRIQSMCKELNEEVIASADLIASIHPDSRYVTQKLGSIRLRGKEKEMQLVSLRPVA
ncbi:MAG TPA: adenylate/guanylate cyclase domain-containing protein [Chitinophaga sp.]|uniref:adenylate/guanylate cyclase domain-containing protein n=1 Tax=Chitinophaga sp. TaxID=1869181 RepID=UPI002C01D6AD|nr:adenylate/guanylate cyclase domain-containing protein [Chitinophaga sp.]HVI43708.1 adenylate/guanylate cyclase domain-containing protein [Chitinophaga sp.]